MRELNENYVYDLSELTSEERKELYEHLCNLHEELKLISVDEYDILEYKTYNKWCYWHKENSIKYKYTIHNAKELFYTLENIQVDCRYLTNDQINEITDIFKKDGYTIYSLCLVGENCFLRQNAGKYCLITTKDENKTTITYDKFMKLFSRKEENFKTFVIRRHLTADAMHFFGSYIGTIEAKNPEHAWELYKEKHKLKDSKDFYSFTEVKVEPKYPNYFCDKEDVYKTAHDLIEKGKQQGLKIVVTFEKL